MPYTGFTCYTQFLFFLTLIYCAISDYGTFSGKKDQWLFQKIKKQSRKLHSSRNHQKTRNDNLKQPILKRRRWLENDDVKMRQSSQSRVDIQPRTVSKELTVSYTHIYFGGSIVHFNQAQIDGFEDMMENFSKGQENIQDSLSVECVVTSQGKIRKRREKPRPVSMSRRRSRRHSKNRKLVYSNSNTERIGRKNFKSRNRNLQECNIKNTASLTLSFNITWITTVDDDLECYRLNHNNWMNSQDGRETTVKFLKDLGVCANSAKGFKDVAELSSFPTTCITTTPPTSVPLFTPTNNFTSTPSGSHSILSIHPSLIPSYYPSMNLTSNPNILTRAPSFTLNPTELNYSTSSVYPTIFNQSTHSLKPTDLNKFNSSLAPIFFNQSTTSLYPTILNKSIPTLPPTNFNKYNTSAPNVQATMSMKPSRAPDVSTAPTPLVFFPPEVTSDPTPSQMSSTFTFYPTEDYEFKIPTSTYTAAPTSTNPTIRSSMSPTDFEFQPTSSRNPITLSPSAVDTITLMISSVSNVSDTGSSQYKALQWALHDAHYSSDLDIYQRYALMTLYYALNGTSWANNNKWGASSTECNWFGLQCDADGNISELRLQNNALNGVMPPEIVLLANIKTIDLSSNSISGAIVENITALDNLNILNLASNQISGAIPNEFSAFSSLEVLILYDNKLIGSIADSFSQLGNLSTFNASINQLTGSIPDSMGNLSKLDTFVFDNNDLSGSIPEAMCDLNVTMLQADCDEVICSCCTMCCDERSGCVSYDNFWGIVDGDDAYEYPY